VRGNPHGVENVNMMVDTVIDTVISNELKGMASEFMGKVRSMDVFPTPADATEAETVATDDDETPVTRQRQ
jgi:hypothetical protein